MKAAIIGCGYVGKTVAHLWKAKGFDVVVTTTSPERVDELSEVSDKVVVLEGSEEHKLKVAIADREIVLLCVGSKRGANYRKTYLGTAQTMAKVLPKTSVKQLIYTSTCSIYGQNSGAWINETMPPNPSTENGKIIEAAEQTLLDDRLASAKGLHSSTRRHLWARAQRREYLQPNRRENNAREGRRSC